MSRSSPIGAPCRRSVGTLLAGIVLALTVVVAPAPAAAGPAVAAPATSRTTADQPWELPCYFTVCLYSHSVNYPPLTAWSRLDVGPTPYYYSVFNWTTGARLALCGFGTSCTTSANVGPPLGRCWQYVAYIGGSGTSMPPAPVRATSKLVTLCNPLN